MPLLWVLAAATVVRVAVFLTQGVVDLAAAEGKAYAEARGAAAVASEQVQNLVRHAGVTAAAAAANPDFWTGDEAARGAVLAALAAPQPDVTALEFFADASRQPEASAALPAASRGTPAGRSAAQEAVAMGRLAVADQTAEGAIDPGPLLSVAVPVRAPDRAAGGAPAAGSAGAVVVTLRLERLPALWAELGLPAGSTVALVDARTGRVLAGSAPPATPVGRSLAAADLGRIRGGERAFRTVAPDAFAGPAGAERLRAWGALAEVPWGIVVDVPAGTVFGPVYAAVAWRVATALVVAGFLFAALLLLWRRFAGTLQRLESATVRWAAGDWEHRAGVGGRDELATLGASSDQMAARLGAADAALQAERAALEARAHARTAELAVHAAALEQANGSLRHEIAERQQAEAAVRDINRRLREALDALAATQEQVVQQERLRALGEMASGIAHDFNNALSPVVGFSELLLARPDLLADPATARRYLGLIHTGGSDAAATVRRLSEFYRPNAAGEGDADAGPVDAHRLVVEVIALTQPRWKDQAQSRGRPVRVITELAPVPPLAGRAEELREVMTNLVFNAVDALPAGGGTVTLRAHPVPAGAGALPRRVVLAVADDGVGMPTEVRRRCLEPFFTTKGQDGSGLGLAMVYGLVRRLRGELEIDSAPGRGTTVRLVLPVYTPPPTAVPGAGCACWWWTTSPWCGRRRRPS